MNETNEHQKKNENKGKEVTKSIMKSELKKNERRRWRVRERARSVRNEVWRSEGGRLRKARQAWRIVCGQKGKVDSDEEAET